VTERSYGAVSVAFVGRLGADWDGFCPGCGRWGAGTDQEPVIRGRGRCSDCSGNREPGEGEGGT
jgi:hypothetical protein